MAIAKTDVLGLNVPDYQEPRWDLPVSENWELLDNAAGFTPAIHKALAGLVGPVVDICVYDTTKDSDGGAWTEKATTQSWYNEPLNTATRGRKKSFPKGPVVIAVENAQVIIFDATEPDCPMWMVFDCNPGENMIQWNITAVNMLNGILCVGHNSAGGLSIVRFIEDYGTIKSTANYINSGNIAQRNDKMNWLGYTDTVIVNPNAVDVGMTILPGAPVSLKTGIAVPTIVTVTPEGFTVVDGAAGVDTAVDFNWNGAWEHGTFEGTRFWGSWPSGAFAMNIIGFVADYTLVSTGQCEADFAAYGAKFYFNQGGGTISHPPPLLSVATTRAVDGRAFGGVPGLNILHENFADVTKGMIAYITDKYNTGWMRGDTRRVVICETGPTNNAVFNGSFDTDVSGWATLGTGVVAWSNGNCLVTNGTASTAAKQAFPTVIGRKYTANFDFIKGTAAQGAFGLGSTDGGYDLGSSAPSATGNYSLSFTAVGTTTYLFIGNNDSDTGITSLWDNIIVTASLGSINLAGNGWTNFGAGYSYETLVSDGPNISAINTTNNAAAYGALLPLVVGNWYRAVIDLTLNSGTAPKFTIGATDNAASGDVISYVLVPGINVITWKCSSTGFRTPWFWQTAPTNTSTDFSATVFIGEHLQDRSSRATYFEVIGDVPLLPVAEGADMLFADLTGVGRFLDQAYSVDLDYAGDFWMAVWLRPVTYGSTEYILSRSSYGAGGVSGPGWGLGRDASGSYFFILSPNSFNNYDQAFSSLTTALVDGEWHLFVGVRRGLTAEIWVDGKLSGTGPLTYTGSSSLANATANMLIGGLNDNTLPTIHTHTGKFSTGNGALSAAEIQKLYFDEKEFMRPYSGAKLKTGISQVDDLTWDDDVLYAAGPGGVTEVRGLTTMLSTRASGAITDVSAAAGILVTGAAAAVAVDAPALSIRSELNENESAAERAQVTANSALSFPIYNASTGEFKRGAVVRVSGAYGSMAAGALSLAAGAAVSSIVNGIAMSKIPAGGQGLLQMCGLIEDVDLTGFVSGDSVYLSSTVAGGYTKALQEVVSNVGMCVVGGLHGSLLIDLFGNRALPTILAVLSEVTTTGITIGTTSWAVAGFTSGEGIRLPYDAPSGQIRPPYAGTYRVNVQISMLFTSTNAARELYIELWNTTDGLIIKSIPQAVARDTDAATFSAIFPASLLANKAYILALRGNVAFDGVSFPNFTYDIESIRVNTIGTGIWA